jgi:hypothetical protein
MVLWFAARSRASRRGSEQPRTLAALVRVGTLLLVVIGVLGGIVLLGRWGLEQLRDRPQYQVALTEVDCAAPPGLSRHDFLDEVRYYSGLPERVSILDEQLAERLRVAFAAHPWVADVGEVTITPPRQVRVELTLRTPVLAVRWNDALRAVDRHGVLLPARAPTRGLPVYEAKARPPQGREGTRWGDADLEREADRLAAQR